MVKKCNFSVIILWFLESMVKQVQLNFSLIINRAHVPVVIQFQREKNPVCQSALSVRFTQDVLHRMSLCLFHNTWAERERPRESQRHKHGARGRGVQKKR